MSIDKSEFSIALMQELMLSSNNWFGADNWDFDRFGEYKTSTKSWLITVANKLLRGKVSLVPNWSHSIQSISSIQHLIEGFSRLYNLLEDGYSRMILVKVIAYRILGHHKVKLPLNTSSYWSQRKFEQSLIKSKETLTAKSHKWNLRHFALDKIGYPIELFTTQSGVLPTFILKQYEYSKQKSEVKAQPRDYVIDAGGCWGDTALYFAHLIGEQGRVYTFEFVPDNLEILRRNLVLNPQLEKRIEVIPNGLWDLSGEEVGYSAHGPGTSLNKENSASTYVSTLSIDDFVRQQKVPRIDYIKMDIEGAELRALKGAEKTIQTFKPKLAIALYHKMEDFVVIPDYLDKLNLGYKFFLDHFTIHSEETVLFASAKTN